MKTYGRVQVYLQAVLTLALEGDKWSVSAPEASPPGKEQP